MCQLFKFEEAVIPFIRDGKRPQIPLSRTGIDLQTANLFLQLIDHKEITQDDVDYINRVLQWVSRSSDVEIEELQNESRKPQLVLARKLVVHVLMASGYFSEGFIAQIIGRDPSLVSHVKKESWGQMLPLLFVEEETL